MPIYEYVCQECQHELEALQKVSDPLLVECPSCNRPGLHKKVSAAGFRLKGGGWYETDFKSDKRKNLAGEGSDSASKGASAGDSAGKGSSAKDSSATGSASPSSSGTSSSSGTGTAGS